MGTPVDNVVDRLLNLETCRHGGMADRTVQREAGRHRTADPDLPCGKTKRRPETSPHRADTGPRIFPPCRREAQPWHTRPGSQRSCADRTGATTGGLLVTVLRGKRCRVTCRGCCRCKPLVRKAATRADRDTNHLMVLDGG